MYVTPANFYFANNFPTLQSQFIQVSINIVNADWLGIFKCWSTLNQAQQIAKQTVLENYLVAWNLGDLYPKALSGVIGNGMPIDAKTIGGTKGVSITMKKMEVQPGLEALMSNEFGILALRMLMTIPERFGIYNKNNPGLQLGAGGGWPL